MAKKFSIVYINDLGMFYSGHKYPKDLAESSDFIAEVFKISQFEKENVVVLHCLLLDFESEEDMDISESDLKDVIEMFDFLKDVKHCIDVVAEVTFEVDGAKAEEIVDG